MHDGPLPAAEDDGFVAAILAEIASHLEELLVSGKEAGIDLRSLPMMPATRQALDRALGEGEVRATVEGAGRSEILETAFTGVWRVSHYDALGTLLMEEIEIAHVPAILKADPTDIRNSAARLGLAADNTQNGEADD